MGEKYPKISQNLDLWIYFRCCSIGLWEDNIQRGSTENGRFFQRNKKGRFLQCIQSIYSRKSAYYVYINILRVVWQKNLQGIVTNFLEYLWRVLLDMCWTGISSFCFCISKWKKLFALWFFLSRFFLLKNEFLRPCDEFSCFPLSKNAIVREALPVFF